MNASESRRTYSDARKKHLKMGERTKENAPQQPVKRSDNVSSRSPKPLPLAAQNPNSSGLNLRNFIATENKCHQQSQRNLDKIRANQMLEFEEHRELDDPISTEFKSSQRLQIQMDLIPKNELSGDDFLQMFQHFGLQGNPTNNQLPSGAAQLPHK